MIPSLQQIGRNLEAAKTASLLHLLTKPCPRGALHAFVGWRTSEGGSLCLTLGAPQGQPCLQALSVLLKGITPCAVTGQKALPWS